MFFVKQYFYIYTNNKTNSNATMKKLFFLFVLLNAFAMGESFAEKITLFSYDQAIIQNEMAQLDQLERIINKSPGTTLSQLNKNDMIDNFINASDFFENQSINEKIGGIGGFWWGFCPSFCLTPVGGGIAVLIVHLAGKDPVETKNAAIGCAVGSIVNVGFIIAYSVLYNASYSYWW
jgi:hypothetical protein